jgi:hypothetical protein
MTCPVPPGAILLAYRGSIAHNMYVPASEPGSIDDVDLMGIVIAPPSFYLGLSKWGSRGTQEHKEGQYDCVFYELRKAVSLLLQGNPNILSVLWLRPEHYLLVQPAGRLLIDNRGLFAGKHVHDAFAGYAHDQLAKMETRDPAELREYLGVDRELKIRGLHPNHKGQVLAQRGDQEHDRIYSPWADAALLQRWRSYHKKGQNLGYMGEKRKRLVLEHGYDAKNAAHSVRLLRMCKEFLETGAMQVCRPDAAELLEIKRGQWPLERVKQHAAELFQQIGQARDRSTLPEGPDRAGAEALLIEILRRELIG